MAEQTIWLVGMMGAGKSVVGRALAQRLALPFIDSDAEIEKRAGARISEIFAERGEPAFRELEAQVIGEIAERSQVVALGGGAAAQPGMAESLAERGTMVYLRADVDTLLARIGDARTRPLLRSLSQTECREKLESLQREREASYSRAQVTVDTDDVSTQTVVETIVDELESRGVG
ncbi:MAG: shikimate kinase [bacterium]|nr:shikimate kinase [bacterium]